MAPAIFLSWSTPDGAHVLRLRDRLRDSGLEVWEYTDDMPGGSHIADDIVRTINQVRVAIICFSDATFDRPWIVTESNWLVKTLRDGDRQLRNIIPIWVGPHPANKVPAALETEGIRTIDGADGSDEQLQRVTADLFKLLGREAPQIVPAALFAMTRPQAEQLLGGMPAAVLTVACTTAGMTSPPPLSEMLAARYGDKPEDLAPFTPGMSLIATINAVLRQANKVRIERNKRPVFLRWMRDEIVGPARTSHARKMWAAGDSLLVVDSVSAFHPAIQATLQALPEPILPHRAALLWLPPYTQHTARLEADLANTADVLPRFGDAFGRWMEDVPTRALAFDTSTPTAARLWLHRAFLDVEDAPEPLPTNVASVQQAAATRVSLSEILPRQ